MESYTDESLANLREQLAKSKDILSYLNSLNLTNDLLHKLIFPNIEPKKVSLYYKIITANALDRYNYLTFRMPGFKEYDDWDTWTPIEIPFDLNRRVICDGENYYCIHYKWDGHSQIEISQADLDGDVTQELEDGDFPGCDIVDCMFKGRMIIHPTNEEDEKEEKEDEKEEEKEEECMGAER